MSGYEKLTVAKLRDELAKRGLQKTGLKVRNNVILVIESRMLIHWPL